MGPFFPYGQIGALSMACQCYNTTVLRCSHAKASPIGPGGCRMPPDGPRTGLQDRSMPKRSRTRPNASSAQTASGSRKPRPGIVHSSVYLPEPIHEALRRAAFEERCRIHDIIMEGIELALRKRAKRR